MLPSPAILTITPLSRFENQRTNIKKPKEFAYFSYDEDRICHPLSTKSLKYFAPPLHGAPGERDPMCPIRLGDGFSTFRKHNDAVDEHLDALLETLVSHEKHTGEVTQAQFVSWRGIFTKLLIAPYEYHDTFELNAVLYQDTIYIEEAHGHKHKQQSRGGYGRGPSNEEMQYWGYKFEALSTCSRPFVETTRAEREARKLSIVSNEEQYCSIVRTGLDGFAIVLAGEVDCVLGEKPTDVDRDIPWVELKTTKMVETKKDNERFTQKLLKYWAQSFLLGVPTIAVGYRDAHGTLVDIDLLETAKLHAMAKRKAAEDNSQTWNGNVCISFLKEVLSFMKDHITDPELVVRISRAHGTNRIVMERDPSIDPTTIITPLFRKHREKQY